MDHLNCKYLDEKYSPQVIGHTQITSIVGIVSKETGAVSVGN